MKLENGYVSPFEHVFRIEDFPDFSYEGTIESILDELTDALEIDASDIDTAKIKALHPLRLIRGLIDFKIENGLDEELLRLLMFSVDFVSAFYREDKDFDAQYLRLKDMLSSYPGLSSYGVSHVNDDISVQCSRPELSSITARELHLFTKDDLLFIPLAHGGLGPGFDVFLNYSQMVPSSKNIIYPVRCSMYKKGDKIPVLGKMEISLLHDLSKERKIVLFDEDIVSGRTMNSAREYFKGIFKKVYTLTNTQSGLN